MEAYPIDETDRPETEGRDPDPRSPRGRVALPFVVLGFTAVVAGGLVSAVAISAPSPNKSWVSAYVVLVVGVSLIVFGSGQALFAQPLPTVRLLATQLAAWVVANALVIVGSLGDVSLLVTIGSILLAGVMVLFARSVGLRRGLGTPRLLAYALYWTVFAIVLVSIPVGILLAVTA